MTQFRPCIDLHDGLVKQVIGGTFAEENGQSPIENFVSERDSRYYAQMYRGDNLVGGHVIMLMVGLTDLSDAEGGLIPRKNILKGVEQLVVVVTNGWDSCEGKLMCFDREGRKAWKPKWDKAVPVMLGSKGLAWGRGVLVETGKKIKKEGDGCTPAGIFKIGKIYGESESLPIKSEYPYHRITKLDAWVDDPKNP